MDEIQEYLNKEYQKKYEDAKYLDSEELSKMNPITDYDIKAFAYIELYKKINAIKAEIATYEDDTYCCKKAIDSNETPVHIKSELKQDIRENNFAIAILEKKLESLYDELHKIKGQTDGKSR